MIPFSEALQIVLSEAKDFGAKSIDLSNALGHILREELISDRPLPPYHRVTMDGIAFQFSTIEKGINSFAVEGTAAAGSPQMTLKKNENCLEVMTGAILPNNCDTVIRYEDILIKNRVATLQVSDFQKRKNVHQKGSDRQQGEILVKKGKKISAAEIGVAATVGKSLLQVSKLPKIAIVSTGDELVNITETPLPHQIRKSNNHSIKAALQSLGIDAKLHHLVDELELVKEKLASLITDNQIIILSGGVSKGKFDYLPEALKQLGVQKLFHKVRQRPGKPFWFGKAQNGTIIFALPGNPVSSFMCTHRYVLPFIKKSWQEEERPPMKAVLAENYFFKPDLTYFLQVKISYSETGQLLAIPVTGNGSGDLANLSDADGFLQLPTGQMIFEKGAVFPLFLYR